MPRDLNAMRDSVLSSMAELHKSPDTIDPPKSSAGSEAAASSTEKPQAKTYRGANKQDPRGKIKPYSQSLTLSNVDSCLALEEATFPPHERCTKEKVGGTPKHWWLCSAIASRHTGPILHRSITCHNMSLQLYLSISALIGLDIIHPSRQISFVNQPHLTSALSPPAFVTSSQFSFPCPSEHPWPRARTDNA